MASRANVRGLSGLRTGLSRLEAEIETGAREATEEIAEILARNIAADAPVDTGALEDSVRAEGSTVQVGDPTVDYAEYVEDDDPFVAPNVQAMRRDGSKIAAAVIQKEIRR
jgi:hypothetical protein